MKILVIGHACSPGLGSEPANTWNWSWRLSQNNQVWVIAHPEYRQRVDDFLATQELNGNLTFLWTTANSRLDYWVPGKEQEKGIRLHYCLWLREAYRRAAALCKEIPFDIVHHVSWTTIGISPPFWKLPAPCVWGPVGGGQSYPSAFRSLLRSKSLKEKLRSAYVRMLPFSPLLRKSAANADMVLAVNRETRDLLTKAGAKNVRLFLDCGVADEVSPPPELPKADEFTLLWAGRVEPQKGLLLALHALQKDDNPAVKMLVAGAGSGEQEMQGLTRSLGLEDRVKFLGRVPHHEMPALFHRCHAFLFTSLRDTFGSVVLEALAHGLPVITLNHQGVGTFVPEDASIKVPVTTLEETKKDLALAIQALASSPEYRAEMSRGALRFAREQQWSHRAEMMEAVYEEFLLSRSSRCPAESSRLESKDPGKSLEVPSARVD